MASTSGKPLISEKRVALRQQFEQTVAHQVLRRFNESDADHSGELDTSELANFLSSSNPRDPPRFLDTSMIQCRRSNVRVSNTLGTKISISYTYSIPSGATTLSEGFETVLALHSTHLGNATRQLRQEA